MNPAPPVMKTFMTSPPSLDVRREATMPPRMGPRLRFLLFAALAALCGAAFELAFVASLRPWTGRSFLRAGLELGALWVAAAAGLALLALAARRARAPDPAGAFLLAPLAWGAAWLLCELDPRGQARASALGLAALLAVAAASWLQARLERGAARFAALSRPARFLVPLAAGTAAALWQWRATTPRPGAPPSGSGANVVWISLDTLRADHLGAYGCERGLTPRLDQLAREGVLFTDATCPMPLTAPAHAAMLTGLPPHESGVHRNGSPLPRATPSVPRLLAARGWETAAFVSGFPLFERSSRLASHFHHYDDELDPRAPLSEGARTTPFGRLALRALRRVRPWREPIERAGDATVDRALAWLEDKGSRPFLLFCHLYDPHAEYVPHPPGRRRSHFWDADSSIERLQLIEDEAERRRTAELYDGEVAFVDAQVGRLLDALRARGLLERTLVLVTSDHGESLGEHDYWYEHINPYQVETQVPLILRLPGGQRAGTRVLGPAQLTDLPRTVGDLLGVALDLPGSSLAGAIESGRIPRRLLFCQSMFDFENAWFAVSVRDGRFKLLRRSPAFERYDSRRVAGSERLFDLHSDPGELRDLIAAGAVPEEARLEELRERLDEYEKACVAVGPDRMDPEVAEQLRRLGYVR
jgi:arylsulfatase A-like enzyme